MAAEVVRVKKDSLSVSSSHLYLCILYRSPPLSSGTRSASGRAFTSSWNLAIANSKANVKRSWMWNSFTDCTRGPACILSRPCNNLLPPFLNFFFFLVFLYIYIYDPHSSFNLSIFLLLNIPSLPHVSHSLANIHPFLFYLSLTFTPICIISFPLLLFTGHSSISTLSSTLFPLHLINFLCFLLLFSFFSSFHWYRLNRYLILIVLIFIICFYNLFYHAFAFISFVNLFPFL